MGTIEYVKCNTCKKFIEIDKLTRHKWYDETDTKELSEDKDEFDDYDKFHISRLLGFLNSHQGCNIEFCNEINFEPIEEGYEEVMKYCGSNKYKYSSDVINFKKPVDRIIIKDVGISDIVIDKRKEDYNCFTVINKKRIWLFRIKNGEIQKNGTEDCPS